MAKAEWVIPIVLATKKNGSKHFCLDYRRLESRPCTQVLPYLRMDEFMNSWGLELTLFELDGNYRFWQEMIYDAESDKLALAWRHGLYRFKRMPFELHNTSGQFQRTIIVILSLIKWQSAMVYLKDIIIFARIVDKHISMFVLYRRSSAKLVSR